MNARPDYIRSYLGLLGVIRAAAAAAVGVEEERRFNFGRSADYRRPRPQSKKKILLGIWIRGNDVLTLLCGLLETF